MCVHYYADLNSSITTWQPLHRTSITTPHTHIHPHTHARALSLSLYLSIYLSISHATCRRYSEKTMISPSSDKSDSREL